MNNKFDELAKGLAQSVTRRAALRKFGLGIVGALAASLGLGSAAASGKKGNGLCMTTVGIGVEFYNGLCIDTTTCQIGASSDCTRGTKLKGLPLNLAPCFSQYFVGDKTCSF